MIRLLTLVAAIASSAPTDPTDSTVRLALSQDWKAIAALPAPVSAAGRVLQAHAWLMVNNPNAYCAFRDGGSPPEWLAFSAQVKAKYPDSAVAHYFHADALARHGDLAAAVDGFSAAIQRDRRFAPAYNARGVTYVMQEQRDRALADFVVAQRLAPGVADFVANRGWLNLTSRQGIAAAVGLFDSALALAPGSASFRAGRAYSLVILNHEQEVRSELAALSESAKGCLASGVAEDLVALAGWASKQLASDASADEPVGTTVTVMLNQLQRGSLAVLPGLARVAAADPNQARRINSYLNHVAARDPVLGRNIATEISRGVASTSPQGLNRALIDVARGLTVRGGNAAVGLTFGAQYLGQTLASTLADRNRAWQGFQRSVPVGQGHNGGVETTLSNRLFDRGDSPALSRFVLAYPAPGKARP